MTETFLNDLHNGDSVKCLNSIVLKDDNKEKDLNRNKSEIDYGISFLKKHPIPAFTDFNKSVVKVTSSVFYSEYTYKDKQPNTTYVMKFSFANFIPDKIYEFRCYEVEAYDSLKENTKVDWSKKDSEQLQKLKPSLH